MLLLNSQEVPNASSNDLDGSSNEGQQLGVAEVECDVGRNSHHPSQTHDEVHHDYDVVVALGLEGNILSQHPIFGIGIKKRPIVLQIPHVGVDSGNR
jgi:hypothetical protein